MLCVFLPLSKSKKITVSPPSVFKTTLQCFGYAKPLYRWLQAPGVEMTWVIADHVAAAGSQELSVHKGQQVEVLELTTATPDWCLVRMPTSGSSVDSPPEGLVPLAVLKQPPPGLKTSPSRRAAADHDSGEYWVECTLTASFSLGDILRILTVIGGTAKCRISVNDSLCLKSKYL
jgi:hypothetical protein